MLSAFVNALKTPDLRRKILFTLGILAIFRLGSVISSPIHITRDVPAVIVSTIVTMAKMPLS